MAKGQLHHCVPVSLACVHYLHNGMVNDANLIRLSESEHQMVHRVLDIDYKLIREFRLRQGYKQWHDLEYHAALQNLQWEYFKKLRMLPHELQKVHTESMRAQCYLLAPIYKYPHEIKDYQMEPYHVMFEYYFNQYHNIFKNYAKKLESRLIQK